MRSLDEGFRVPWFRPTLLHRASQIHTPHLLLPFRRCYFNDTALLGLFVMAVLGLLNAVGLGGYFDPIIIFGDFSYQAERTPVHRSINYHENETVRVFFVGDDLYRDAHGAQRLGIKTVFCKSNQGTQDKESVKPDYNIYNFPELLNATLFFEDQSIHTMSHSSQLVQYRQSELCASH